jgi:hypothetical protein
VGDTLDVAKAHGQQRLGVVQSLDLCLLVDAEQYGPVPRFREGPPMSWTFLDKEGIR